MRRRSQLNISLLGLSTSQELSEDRQFAMNLARGIEVLRAFTAAAPLLGNREISDRTGLPKATVSRLTYTLTTIGLLSHDIELQKYRLGVGLLSLSHPLMASLHVRQIAHPLMERLARETGCTINLGMRERGNVVYVDTVRVDKGNTQHPDIGSSRPLLATAIGRALILGSEGAESTAILNYLKVRDYALFEEHSDAWEADRRRFAAQGYCRADGSWKKDLYAVALPLRLQTREPLFAMNCTLAASRMPEARLERDVLPQLREAVREIKDAYGLA